MVIIQFAGCWLVSQMITMCCETVSASLLLFQREKMMQMIRQAVSCKLQERKSESDAPLERSALRELLRHLKMK